MLKLNDTHTLLLSTTSQRESCSPFPLPDTITAGARVTKALTALTNAGLIE